MSFGISASRRDKNELASVFPTGISGGGEGGEDEFGHIVPGKLRDEADGENGGGKPFTKPTGQ